MADQNKTKKGPKPPKHPCLRCRRAVTTDTKSVQCQTCEFWVHVDCQGISDKLFNILVDLEKYGGVCWNCDSCLASTARLERHLKSFEARVNQVEAATAKTSSDLKVVDAKVDNLRRDRKRNRSRSRERVERREEEHGQRRSSWPGVRGKCHPCTNNSSSNSNNSSHATQGPNTAAIREPRKPGQDREQEAKGERRCGVGKGDGGGRGGGAPEPAPKKINIMYTNSQSLPGKVQELEALANDLKPDMILLCETWCNANISNATLNIEGYELQQSLRKDRSDTVNGIGGGLVVYTRDGLRILPCDEENSFNQYCKLCLTSGGEKYYIYLVYRPPSSGQENKELLSELVREASRNSLMIGDFNLPGIDWDGGVAEARD